eukprot:Lithocolla_globosa_v1_NODE_412_length_4122_cov_166.322351.p2 type:complete len:186 gc:universal NODE_412_length_4122_cov_166.322351:3386-3943(+)
MEDLLQECTIWAARWRVTFNHTKSGCIRYCRADSTVSTLPNFFLTGTLLPWVNNYRYLGWLIGTLDDLSGELGLAGRANAARAAADAIVPVLDNAKVEPSKRLFYYHRYVQLVLDYATEAVELSPTQLFNCDLKEKSILSYMSVPAESSYTPFSARWSTRRARFLSKLRIAPIGSLRRHFADLVL